MSGSHTDALPTGNKEKARWLALALNASFMIAEVIAGFLSGSLALISDAAHMLTDAGAPAVALAAVNISKRPTDVSRTYSYYRFEILAVAFIAVMLFAVGVPRGIELAKVQASLLAFPGVTGVPDVHIWAPRQRRAQTYRSHRSRPSDSPRLDD